jgi:hypothetical protein
LLLAATHLAGKWSRWASRPRIVTPPRASSPLPTPLAAQAACDRYGATLLGTRRVPEGTVQQQQQQQQPEGKLETELRKMSAKANLIGILVAVGGLVAMIGSASLPPGVGQLLVGTDGLVVDREASISRHFGQGPASRGRGRPAAVAPP